MANSEWYRAVRPEAFIGIPRSDVDALLYQSGGEELVDLYAKLIDANTVEEPYHVDREDEDAGAPPTPRYVVAIQIEQFQVDAGLNETPRCTASAAVGRDGAKVGLGLPDDETISVIHLLERFLATRHLPATLYSSMYTTDAVGVGDDYDNQYHDGEWVVMFDGLLTGLSRRGSAESAQIVVHMLHFSAVLGFSSSLTAHTAAGTGDPISYNPMTIPFRASGFLRESISTFGTCCLGLAGGPTAQTDFWGFMTPPGPPKEPPFLPKPANFGLKGFLYGLAQLDTFNWPALTRADLGASPGAGTVFVGPNTQAIKALMRIEPYWPNWDEMEEGEMDALWASMRVAVDGARQANLDLGSTKSVTRADVVLLSGGDYEAVGYQYGLPVSFFLHGSRMGAFSIERGFASDVFAASFPNLSGSSFWDLMLNYSSRYQIAFAPMANRAVVIPFQPMLDKQWQSVGASEITSWNDDFQTPRPIRGVVMTGLHKPATGFAAGSAKSSPGAMKKVQQMSAAYDSGEEGQFEFRALPTWLADAYRQPVGSYGTKTLTPAGRAMTAAPWSTVLKAKGVPQELIDTITLVGGVFPFLPGLTPGMDPAAMGVPPDWATTTANRMAKALFQQERTRHRTFYVGTRFRYDIGPGSMVKFELPSDRYVRGALVGTRNSFVVGMVTRVTVEMNRQKDTAETWFQVGFVRTEAEADTNSVLYADSHPFWVTAALGVPWADARWIRDTLGDGSTLVPPPPPPP